MTHQSFKKYQPVAMRNNENGVSLVIPAKRSQKTVDSKFYVRPVFPARRPVVVQPLAFFSFNFLRKFLPYPLLRHRVPYSPLRFGQTWVLINASIRIHNGHSFLGALVVGNVIGGKLSKFFSQILPCYLCLLPAPLRQLISVGGNSALGSFAL